MWEINQGYTTMHGQPIIKILTVFQIQRCSFSWTPDSNPTKVMFDIFQNFSLAELELQLFTSAAVPLP
jgi:hypothetical protein